MDELQAASAVGQGRLYREYEELLTAAGLRSAQVLLTFFDMSARTHYLNARHTLQTLLRWRVLPVINENDTTTTDEISFGDNDFLAAQVAVLMSADILLLLTNTDGLHTADPHRDPKARRIDSVTSFDELEPLQIGVSKSPLGSGGMKSKVVAAEMATAAGIGAAIIDGTTPGSIEAALRGDSIGTRFLPAPGRTSSFKLWLKYAKPTQGRLVVDAGAEAALRERGTSLLPVGIVEVHGDFQAGDAVEVRGSDGPIGKGIVNYDAGELRRVKGMKTKAARDLLPQASEEAVHRDYFVLD
jgi:glutamate 5-kinase